MKTISRLHIPLPSPCGEGLGVRLLLIFLLLPFVATAQTQQNSDAEAGARLAVSVDKKITKGLHVALEEELRFDNNLSSFNRFQTTLSVSYKVLPFLKLGMGYSLINRYDSYEGAFKNPRHRFYLEAKGTCHLGDWQFSLRERIQATHRTGSFNPYQNTANSWALKSRLKVAYNGLRRFTPYASAEMRLRLNAPVINAVYNTANDTWGYYTGSTFYTTGTEGWFLESFTGTYADRLRFTLGTTYRIDKRNTIDLYLMADYDMEKSIDANAEGTRLKSYTLTKGMMCWIGVSYQYKF